MCKREAKEKNNLAHQYKNPWEADTVTNTDECTKIKEQKRKHKPSAA